MIKILAIIIIITICIMFLLCSRKLHGSDLFAPLSFFALFFCVTRIPRLIRADEILYGFHDKITNYMLCNYLIITVVFLLSVLIGGIVKVTRVISGTLLISGYKKKTKYSFSERNINYSKLFHTGVICFAIGAFSKIFLILRAGGLRTIWSSLYNRTNMLAGVGYIDYLTICMTFGLASIEICVLNNKRHKICFFVLCGIAAILNIAFGNRSPLLKLLFALVFVYWYTSLKKITWKKIFSIRNIILITILISLIIILPKFRSANFQLNAINWEEYIKDSAQNVVSIFDEISFFDEDVYSFNYFSKGKFWLGKSYIGLLTAWIPRAFYSEKPPIDDGMYLRAIMKGYDVVPPMSVYSLNNLTVSSSIPFTTCGIMYANFGVIGVIIGGLLTGKLIVGQYEKMKRTKSIADILIYQIVCTRLAFTNKGIVELIVSVVIFKCICGFVYKIQGVNKTDKLVLKEM